MVLVTFVWIKNYFIQNKLFFVLQKIIKWKSNLDLEQQPCE